MQTLPYGTSQVLRVFLHSDLPLVTAAPRNMHNCIEGEQEMVCLFINVMQASCNLAPTTG
jgi:hypothetical protein